MFFQVQATAGQSFNPGEVGIFTGVNLGGDVWEVCKPLSDGGRIHFVALDTIGDSTSGPANAFGELIYRVLAGAVAAYDRLTDTSSGKPRLAASGEATNGVALTAGMAGDTIPVFMVPWTGLRRYRSGTRTGTGAAELIPHGLGGIPDAARFSLLTLPAGTSFLAAQGATTWGPHTATDLVLTVTTGIEYELEADRFA